MFVCIARPRESSRTVMAKVGSLISQYRLQFMFVIFHQPIQAFFFMQHQEQNVTSQNRPSSAADPEAHSFFALRRYHAELFSCPMHQVSATAASSRPEVDTAAANTPQHGDEWYGWIYSEARFWAKMWFQASKGFVMSLANTGFLILNENKFDMFFSHVFFIFVCSLAPGREVLVDWRWTWVRVVLVVDCRQRLS